ncbi:hypothetical protein GN956_G17281 [Arapaima gigas]
MGGGGSSWKDTDNSTYSLSEPKTGLKEILQNREHDCLQVTPPPSERHLQWPSGANTSLTMPTLGTAAPQKASHCQSGPP